MSTGLSACVTSGEFEVFSRPTAAEIEAVVEFLRPEPAAEEEEETAAAAVAVPADAPAPAPAGPGAVGPQAGHPLHHGQRVQHRSRGYRQPAGTARSRVEAAPDTTRGGQ